MEYVSGVVWCGVMGSDNLTTNIEKYLRFKKFTSKEDCTETFIMAKCLPPTKNRFMYLRLRDAVWARFECDGCGSGRDLNAKGAFWARFECDGCVWARFECEGCVLGEI